jgi:hypothetical protein
MKVLDKHNYIKVGQKPINIYTDRAWKAKATKLGVSKEWIKNAESKVWYNKHS